MISHDKAREAIRFPDEQSARKYLEGQENYHWRTELPDDWEPIVDRVLAYRPKPKTKAAKRRIRRNKRKAKGNKHCWILVSKFLGAGYCSCGFGMTRHQSHDSWKEHIRLEVAQQNHTGVSA